MPAEAARRHGVDGGEAAGSRDLRTPKRDVPTDAQDRTESPTKTRKPKTDKMDSEPTNDLLLFMEITRDSHNNQLKRLEMRFGLQDQRNNVTEGNYHNLVERLDNPALTVVGPDDRWKEKLDEIGNSIHAGAAVVNKRLGEVTQQHQQAAAAAAAQAPEPVQAQQSDHIVIVKGFKRETPKGHPEQPFERNVKPHVCQVLGNAECHAPDVLLLFVYGVGICNSSLPSSLLCGRPHFAFATTTETCQTPELHRKPRTQESPVDEVGDRLAGLRVWRRPHRNFQCGVLAQWDDRLGREESRELGPELDRD